MLQAQSESGRSPYRPIPSFRSTARDPAPSEFAPLPRTGNRMLRPGISIEWSSDVFVVKNFDIFLSPVSDSEQNWVAFLNIYYLLLIFLHYLHWPRQIPSEPHYLSLSYFRKWQKSRKGYGKWSEIGRIFLNCESWIFWVLILIVLQLIVNLLWLYSDASGEHFMLLLLTPLGRRKTNVYLPYTRRPSSKWTPRELRLPIAARETSCATATSSSCTWLREINGGNAKWKK